jgi:hypothetical protein
MGEPEEDHEGLSLHVHFGDRLVVLIDEPERSADQRGGLGDGAAGLRRLEDEKADAEADQPDEVLPCRFIQPPSV